ncbi:hypothetical protein L798_01079 [Zootermopsis nevadensis]|uniref:Uncharacterized protein n=1 Tax=Zootermopsis nevadensis TaxID=136037 RepID=A0A067RH47_ZOONE|nr:hypothetical protein L798_01079 [Zootermopsis nevadensis]
MEAEIESLKAKVAEQQNEINRKDGALDQYERKLLYMEALQYEFGTNRQKGREMEEDNRRMMLTNENLRAELDDLVKKHHDLKTTSEEIKLLVLQREVERAEKDGLFLTFEDLLKSAADLKQLIERAKMDPSAFVAMSPVQKKVYNLSAALYERLFTIDVQEMEIKRLRADLYAKEKEIKKLRVVAQDVKLYENDIMNLRYTHDELEYKKW